MAIILTGNATANSDNWSWREVRDLGRPNLITRQCSSRNYYLGANRVRSTRQDCDLLLHRCPSSNRSSDLQQLFQLTVNTTVYPRSCIPTGECNSIAQIALVSSSSTLERVSFCRKLKAIANNWRCSIECHKRCVEQIHRVTFGWQSLIVKIWDTLYSTMLALRLTL